MNATAMLPGRRFVWRLVKPNGATFRPKRNHTARQVRRCAERLTGESWRALWTAGYRVERVPVRTRRPKPRLVS